MPRRRKGDHVVYDFIQAAMVCRHCGDSYKPNQPAPLPVMVAMMQAYAKLHRDCPAPVVPSMDDLSKCPQCGGPADNGHDRCIPPSAYMCSQCSAREEEERAAAEGEKKPGEPG